MDRERLAEICYEQWARWAGRLLEDLSQRALIVNRLPEVCKWRARFETPYSDLNGSQREPFLRFADRVLSLLG